MVVLCSGDLKACMVKVNAGPLCEGYLVLLNVSLGSLHPILLLNPLPLPSLLAIYSPSWIPLHTHFLQILFHREKGLAQKPAFVWMQASRSVKYAFQKFCLDLGFI